MPSGGRGVGARAGHAGRARGGAGGARQTGKTTLVRSLPRLADRPSLVRDDFDLCARSRADPEAIVARAPAIVVAEVDLVIESGKRLLHIEVKAAARGLPADARRLEAFLDGSPDRTDGALLL